MTLNKKAFECTFWLLQSTFVGFVLYYWITVECLVRSEWLSTLMIIFLVGAAFLNIFWFFKALFSEVIR